MPNWVINAAPEAALAAAIVGYVALMIWLCGR